MRQKSDTAGPRPMKTLLVASLIASQCITNVVAFPIPSQSQSGNDSDQEKHSKLVEAALKANRCAHNPLDCVENTALSGVEHISTALSHGIVAGSDKLTKVGHRVGDRVDNLREVKDAFIHGEAPEDDENWHPYVKRESTLFSEESPYYHLNQGTETNEHILRQHNMNGDLLKPKEEESGNSLAKRAPPPHVTAKSAATATLVMGTAAAGILGGALYAGNLIAKGFGKGVNELQHHNHHDDDDDDDRRHFHRQLDIRESNLDDQAMVKRGWGRSKPKAMRTTTLVPEYTINKKTALGIRTAGVIGLTAAAAGGTALIYNAMKNKDDDHHHRRSLFTDDGEVLNRRSPLTFTEVPADTPADKSSRDIKPKKVKKTFKTPKVVKPKKKMSMGKKTALAAGLVTVVGAGGYLADKIFKREYYIHGDAASAVPLKSTTTTEDEEKSVYKRDLTRKTGAIKLYQPSVITKKKPGMGMKGKLAVGAGAVLALGGLYKGIQYLRQPKPKGDGNEQLNKRGANNVHEVHPMHRIHALKTEENSFYDHLGDKYTEHQEGKSKVQTPEEIKKFVQARNRALPGGYLPEMDQSVHALKTEELRAYHNMMSKLDRSPESKAKTNDGKGSPSSTQGGAPSEDPIVSQIKQQQKAQEQQQKAQEQQRLEKGKAALEKLRRQNEDPIVRKLREIREEQEKNSGS